MKKTLLACAVSTAVMLPSLASAELSTTVTVVSDYTFNGVSQTDNSPALQASLDYGTDDFYVGTWASNVDFGGDTNLELDFYAGKYFQLSQAASIDAGLSYYTYHGDSDNDDGFESMDLAYGEAYGKFGFASELGQTELNFWYAWDYAGSDEAHLVSMLAQSYDVAEGHTLRLSIDQSMFMDSDIKAWGGDSSYVHYRLEYQTSYEGFDFVVAAEDTTIDSDSGLADSADARLVAGVSYTFGL
jgi:uncharacterized protein (TIGR02001 family)